MDDLELRISKFLRAGVITAGIFLFIGWMSLLFANGSSFVTFQTYHAIPLSESLGAALDAHSWTIIIAYVGLIILISLPILRVMLTAFIFLKQKEYLLAGIAGFVLITLILSFALGIEL